MPSHNPTVAPGPPLNDAPDGGVTREDPMRLLTSGGCAAVCLWRPVTVAAQEPAAWGPPSRDLHETVSESPGFRTLEQPIRRDVRQLELMLHARGFCGADEPSVEDKGPQANVYTQEAVEAVDRFRAAQSWQTTVPGYVDTRTVARLWQRLDEAGRAEAVRRQLLDLRRVR
jgi:hypothetical protein